MEGIEPDDDRIRFTIEPTRVRLAAASRFQAQAILETLQKGCSFTPYAFLRYSLWRKLVMTIEFELNKNGRWKGVHLKFAQRPQYISNNHEITIDESHNGIKWPFIYERFLSHGADKITLPELARWAIDFSCWGMSPEDVEDYLFYSR